MGDKNLSELLTGFQTPGTEEEVKKLGVKAVPVILKAFKSLDHYNINPVKDWSWVPNLKMIKSSERKSLSVLFKKYVDVTTFNKAFFALLSGGFTNYNLIFFESRCKARICDLALSGNEQEVQISAYAVNQLISKKKNSISVPIELILQYVLKIDGAVARARKKPGETWEDRNWGGYNMSGEEQYAQVLSDGIRSLAILKYHNDELEKFKKVLSNYSLKNLSKLILVNSTSFSIDYTPFDLQKALGL